MANKIIRFFKIIFITELKKTGIILIFTNDKLPLEKDKITRSEILIKHFLLLRINESNIKRK